MHKRLMILIASYLLESDSYLIADIFGSSPSRLYITENLIDLLLSIRSTTRALCA
ncbi:hypothetical protein ACJX0J_024851, partial [Zea mays]